MHTRTTSDVLRRLLMADALISGATGILMVSAAPALAGLFELPVPLLRYAGLALLPFAVLVMYLSRSARLAPSGVRTVIALNGAWVVASVVVLMTGWIAPNGLGVAFVVLQAMAVAVLAELQYIGLRRAAGC